VLRASIVGFRPERQSALGVVTLATDLPLSTLWTASLWWPAPVAVLTFTSGQWDLVETRRIQRHEALKLRRLGVDSDTAVGESRDADAAAPTIAPDSRSQPEK
jgi:hypothetical protein